MELKMLHEIKLLIGTFSSMIILFTLLGLWIRYPNGGDRTDGIVILTVSLIFTGIIWGFFL